MISRALKRMCKQKKLLYCLTESVDGAENNFPPSTIFNFPPRQSSAKPKIKTLTQQLQFSASISATTWIFSCQTKNIPQRSRSNAKGSHVTELMECAVQL
jgi:hypothetical protein